MYEYKCDVTRVVDGDTFYGKIDLGFFASLSLKFRLKGIDTPEIYRPLNEAEKQHGMEAKEFVSSLILNKTVVVRSNKTGKYGRWIAEVILEDGTDLVTVLIENGFQKRVYE